MSKNPYEPPKTDPIKDYDRWTEAAKKREETDWTTFTFIFIGLSIFFFYEILFRFTVDILR
tara:strand:+ start:226 stop:408 length:183 start_codon:yes stop_codon:yes gene_type:complete